MSDAHGQIRNSGEQTREVGPASQEERHAQERLGPGSAEPETGGCDRPGRSAPRGRQGPHEKERLTARVASPARHALSMSEPKHSWRTMSLASVLLVCVAACATSSSSHIATTSAAAGPPVASAGVPNLYDAQRQVEQYIVSGRYEADVANVVAGARAWLEER